MKLSNITPEQAHQVAMAAVHKSHEGMRGTDVARVYREAYLNCNEEPEQTGYGDTMAKGVVQPPKPEWPLQFASMQELREWIEIRERDPLAV